MTALPAMTVDERGRLYNARDLGQIDKVLQLSASLGFPPMRTLVKMVRRGKMKNCEVEVIDVLNAARVHDYETDSVGDCQRKVGAGGTPGGR